MAEWNTMLRRVQGKIFNCKNFMQIQRMVETDKLSYKALSILTLMLPNLNEEGLGQIDRNMDLFTQILQQKSTQADATWQGVFKSFIFNPEKESIEGFLAS